MNTLAEIAVDSLVNVGEVGVIGGSFFFMLRWMLTSFKSQMESQSSATRANTAATLGVQKMLMAHDLTVRGVNPTAGDSEEERNKTAYIIYKQIQSSLDKAIDTITEKQ